MGYEITNIDENTLKVKLSGNLDIGNSNVIGNKIDNSIKDNVKKIIFDLSEVTHISSVGVCVLALVAKKMKEKNGVIKVEKIPENILRILRVIEFDKYIN